MKYIMLERPLGDGTMVQKLPVIFPDHMVHADVAEALMEMKHFEGMKVTSAGHLDLDVNCVDGESTTLGLASKEEDVGIINMINYNSIFEAFKGD